MFITINISKQRIIGGKGRIFPCPIEKVIKPFMKKEFEVHVYSKSIEVHRGNDSVWNGDLPEKANRFINQHDHSYRYAEPVSFKLNIPARFLK